MSMTARMAHRLEELVAEVEADPSRALAVVTRGVTELPGCFWSAAVQVDDRSRPHLLASDGVPAADAVAVERATGQGPAIAAARADAPIHVAAFDVESRWPRFAAAVRDASPARGAIACRLVDGRAPVVLVAYSASAGDFAGETGRQIEAYAWQARVLMRHVAALERIEHLSTALTTSRLIGSAVGIVMLAHDLPYDEAFDVLRRTSEATQVRVSALAGLVVESGRLPAQWATIAAAGRSGPRIATDLDVSSADVV